MWLPYHVNHFGGLFLSTNFRGGLQSVSIRLMIAPLDVSHADFICYATALQCTGECDCTGTSFFLTFGSSRTDASPYQVVSPTTAT